MMIPFEEGTYPSCGTRILERLLSPDGLNGLVQTGSHPIQVTTVEKLILDCRTTMPNITVYLKKDYQEVDNTDKRRMFDPKRGYVISNLRIQDTGNYMCSTYYEADYLLYFVTVHLCK
ncbi:hypothetical protein SK128_024465 [Halocaridina rubra]|uniref:Uncharacterized protein n=1 Tax=Halocaridina rubra TaxID=373956 RepID=A0AAN9A4W3_HALRR